jgi:hypothetical protein
MPIDWYTNLELLFQLVDICCSEIYLVTFGGLGAATKATLVSSPCFQDEDATRKGDQLDVDGWEFSYHFPSRAHFRQ